MNEAVLRNLAGMFAFARTTCGFLNAEELRQVEDFAGAYRLQERWRAELNAKVVGWKLAAPSPSEVISAPLLDIECLASGSMLGNAALLRDGVECEVAMRIDRPLPSGECSRNDVARAVGAVMPAFELLCSRLPAGFASPREQIVADGMGQGAVVLGSPVTDWRALDFNSMRVTLWVNDKLVVDRSGGNPFGDPLNAVALLANHLALRGEVLPVGTFVLAGSHTGVHKAQPGEHLRCVFEGVGQVTLAVSRFSSNTSKEHEHAGR